VLSGILPKDEILAHALTHNLAIWIILSFSSLLTAFYMFRLVYLTFFNTFRGSEETRSHIHESSWTMTIPLVILCALAVVGGIMGLPTVFHAGHWLHAYLAPVTESSSGLLHLGPHPSHTLEIGLMTFAGLAAILTILYARRKYVTLRSLPEDESTMTGFRKLIYNKFYMDALYDQWIVKPTFRMSEWFGHVVDKKLIDRLVNGTGTFMDVSGRTLRWFQNGNTGSYIFMMVMGMVILFLLRLMI
jgi:NADH-quinone oxidoreductase subunit L